MGDGVACTPDACDPVCTFDEDCDDGNVCTIDTCTARGFCAYENEPNGTSCADDVFCDGEETCQGGVCLSLAPVDCDDGIGCTIDVCDVGLDECVSVAMACNNDGVCDRPCEHIGNCPNDCDACPCELDMNEDGHINLTDVLSVMDCARGVAPPAPATCDNADLDCSGVIDHCDVSRVWCGFSQAGGCCEPEFACGACCNAGIGVPGCILASPSFCEGVIVTDGVYMGDETVCTPWPCDSTACIEDEDCNDGNTCTVGTCNAGGVCVFEDVSDGTPCRDGNLCDGDETCQAGVCVGEPLDCDDDNVCTTDICDPATGCINEAVEDGTSCGDGSQQCIEGVCVGAQPCTSDLDCVLSNNNACEWDSCDEVLGRCRTAIPRMFGDVCGPEYDQRPNGTVNLTDVLCTLNGFGPGNMVNCPNADVAMTEADECPAGNGLINLTDVIRVLDAFGAPSSPRAVYFCDCPGNP